MKKTKPQVTSVVTDTPALSQQQLIAASVNLPSDQFTLGDRSFPIQDLSYDNYIEFIGHLTPLIELVVEKVASKQGISVPGIDLKSSLFSPANILSLCSKELPLMVQIMCRQSDPTFTVDQVKEHAKRPTVLALAVIAQIKKNDMIKDFADFFGQVLSVVKQNTTVPSRST